MSLWLLLLLLILTLILFFVLINLKWWVHTIRDIASTGNQGGYTKLIQVGLIVMLIVLFISIFIYYLVFPGQVDRIDVIQTVIVGWLGLIIGKFFSESAMEILEEKRQIKVRKADILLKEYRTFMEDLTRKLGEKRLQEK